MNLEFAEPITPAAGDRPLTEKKSPAILLGGNSGEKTPILTESTPLGKMLRARYLGASRSTSVPADKNF
ncbi:MAG: hypothetical protein HC942_13415, partial [Microcoleus sp. SU_5_6]|nr:hypothetical protein [Microcoleus sp. SU_5_6]